MSENQPDRNMIAWGIVGSVSNQLSQEAQSLLAGKIAEALAGTEPDGFATLAQLRGEGWNVAAHNDYRLRGENWTFYLMTHPTGIWAKGEGRTDAEALAVAKADASARTAGRPTPSCETP